MKKRVFGLDLVRVVAIMFVVFVHFFSKNGFYRMNLNNKYAFLLLGLRWLFYTCVPLFIILTGYLKCNNKLDKKHYKGIINVLISYVFIEIIIYLFKKYYLLEDINFIRHIINILGFQVSDYSWYVEMYIGLFLLIPFLNLIYNNLENEKQKKFLIITFLLLTAFPSIFSNMKLDINIFPDWWSGIYPISYYFIGCYIREYQLKFNKFILILCICLLLFFQTVFTFFNSYNNVLDWNFMGGYGSITVTITTFLIFLVLYDLNIKNKFLKKVINKISIHSFDMYLFSYILDMIIYPKVRFTYIWTDLKFMFVPLLVLLGAYILSFAKNIVLKVLKKAYIFIINRKNNKVLEN